MSEKMRILYLTQWFDPEPAFKGAAFARALVDAGNDVRVVTGFPNYPGGKLYPGYRIRPFAHETIDGVSVLRLPLWPSHDRSRIGRSLNYLSFFLSALVYCLLRVRRYDIAYVYHPPLTPALAAALAGMVHRTPFIIDIQDMWPDTVAVSGMGNDRILAILNRLCQFVYRRAAHILCQSDGMVKMLVERGVPESKLTCIYNWSNYRPAADGVPGFSESFASAFKGRVNLVYGGNIGQAQALEHLVKAAIDAQRDVPELRLHIVGHGIERDRIAALAASAPDTVRLYDRVPRQTMDRIFECADILALHLKDDPLFKYTIPSKLQHYLSIGKPIVAGIGGEAAEILHKSAAARVSSPCDVGALARNIVEVARMDAAERAAMSMASVRYYNEHMNFEGTFLHTLALLQSHRKSGLATINQVA